MYSSERNHQIVIELLKYHKIHYVVASPGATNVSFIASIQNDPFFSVFSCVDERSAAYMACGIASETGETVILSCTGATASRNYMPGLTEAYYRKLPILAITSTMPLERIGHNFPQQIDRTIVAKDIVKASYYIPFVDNEEDEWICNVKVNDAILELKHHSIGPVHINLVTKQSGTFGISNVKPAKPINRFNTLKKLPEITVNKLAIFIGEHYPMTDKEIKAIDEFCEKYNGVVIGDHTCNYFGKYFINASIITNQDIKHSEFINIPLLIHLGTISGAYLAICPKEVWRLCEDGKLVDTFQTLRNVFEMSNYDFFNYYNAKINSKSDMSYYNNWNYEYNKLLNRLPNVPFSNIWIAKQISKILPKNCELHLGILNSLRSWNFFEIDSSIIVHSNTGGFGIDGTLSTVIGAAMVNPNKLFFCVLGDLAFFYDVNVLGNRHVPNNLRILMINNGHGQEFRNYNHRAAQFGEDTDKYIAAAWHNGNKSMNLVKGIAESLGYQYFEALSKDDFLAQIDAFITPQFYDQPIIFEAFTQCEDENNAIRIMSTIEGDTSIKEKLKNFLTKTL